MTAMPYGVAEKHGLEAKASPRRAGGSRPAARAKAPAQPRRFLFLRSPFGPFFARVASGLEAQGAEVRKIKVRAIDRMQTMRKPAGI